MASSQDEGDNLDGTALFGAFMAIADRLRMHPDERCDILGVSVETWRAIVRGTAEHDVLHSDRATRRLRYAIGLMQRRLDNEAAPPPPPT
jgi:hypothetical protein